MLFITSVDRPFTESERAFLERTRDWGKKIVVVLNKTDILEAGPEVAEVRHFVAESAQHLLGLTPEIFPVSARLAMRAKQGEREVWDASGFERLERYVQDTARRRRPHSLEAASTRWVWACISAACTWPRRATGSPS